MQMSNYPDPSGLLKQSENFMSHSAKITLTLFCCLCFGCSKNPNPDYSTTAAAEMTSDGAIVTRETTEEERAHLDELIADRAKIDQQFPGPVTPLDAPLFKAVRVKAPGVIELSDGRLFQMDGVTCNTEGMTSVSLFAIGEDTSVAVIPSGSTTDQPTRADIWSVDISIEDNKPMNMFTSLAEISLSNGWCVPDPASTSKYVSRYTALSKQFSSGQK